MLIVLLKQNLLGSQKNTDDTVYLDTTGLYFWAGEGQISPEPITQIDHGLSTLCHSCGFAW